MLLLTSLTSQKNLFKVYLTIIIKCLIWPKWTPKKKRHVTGPGGNVGPGNLKQKIQKDYCSASLNPIFYPKFRRKKSRFLIFFLTSS